jgi:Protein of unknown function (DUF3567)
MHMLYDSESFVVVHMQANPELIEPKLTQLEATQFSQPTDPVAQAAAAGNRLIRHGFEIVDKRTGKEVYLDGSWAELFQRQITAWQNKTPTQQEVEDTLDGYAELAQNRVVMH